MEIGSYTDKGALRAINEDDYYVSDYVSDVDAIYAVVADGMGGHLAGDIASSMAIHVACDYIEANFDASKESEGVAELLKNAVTYANNTVFSRAGTNEDLSGMGTTFSLVFVLGKKAIICHVGDSRIYLLRDGKIKKLTTDHSLVEELVLKGSITETEAKDHPHRNIITRALGASAEVEADIFEKNLKVGDILLLCSDGLTNEVSENEILEIVAGEEMLMSAAQKLTFKAIDNGGKDNITAVLLKI